MYFRTPISSQRASYDNIAMHRDVSREAVEQAAKAARCHEFILSLPDGYNTRLGDGGHKLSGGETQRIAIARAILKDAPIVVLDEAMAFADAEKRTGAAGGHGGAAPRARTVLMIAHRLYSIRDADCIYVLGQREIGRKRDPTRSFWIKMACMPIFGLFRMRRKSGR